MRISALTSLVLMVLALTGGFVLARTKLPVVALSVAPQEIARLPAGALGAARLEAVLSNAIYGPRPSFDDRRVTGMDPPRSGTEAVSLRAFMIEYGLRDGTTRQMPVVAATQTDRPRAVILIQSFCGITGALAPLLDASGSEDEEGPCGAGWAMPLVRTVFGAHAGAPPLERLLASDYAVAVVDQTRLMPDQRAALPLLDVLSPPQGPRTGAIRVWAEAYIDAAHELDRIYDAPVILFGHSRNAKSALLAGATDPNIAGVIAHQSGTAGATPLRSARGEPIAAINTTYPYWFTPAFADISDHLPDDYDQHLLIAPMAGRPLLLGNARQDAWSDPQGAFAAMRGADASVPDQLSAASDMRDFRPEDPVAYWLRDGRHGITRDDWRAFERWLDVHF